MHFTGGGAGQSTPLDPELQDRYEKARNSVADIYVKPEDMSRFEGFVDMNNEGAKDEIISAYNYDPMTSRTGVRVEWLDAIMTRAMMRILNDKGIIFKNIPWGRRGGRKSKRKRRKSSTRAKKGKKTRRSRK